MIDADHAYINLYLISRFINDMVIEGFKPVTDPYEQPLMCLPLRADHLDRTRWAVVYRGEGDDEAIGTIWWGTDFSGYPEFTGTLDECMKWAVNYAHGL